MNRMKKRAPGAFRTLFAKELARFFGDRRLAFTTLLLPGLMIYVMYSFMGSALAKQFGPDEEHVPLAAVAAPSAAVQAAAEQAGFRFEEISADGLGDAKARLADKTLDLAVVFPAGFDAAVAAYEPSSGTPAPDIEVYYNSASPDSQAAWNRFSAVLDAYEATLANKFDVNAGAGIRDVAPPETSSAQFFSSLLPMLLMVFLFSGCLAVAPESIAGEKERGTIAALLIAPVRRSDIALGKIAALSLIALLAGLSSALGTFFSLPRLMSADSAGLPSFVYGPADYAQLGGVILSTVLVLVSAVAVLSAFAKTVREAQTYVTPLMILCMLAGITAMFGSGAKTQLFWYAVPLYNSVQCMQGVLSLASVPGGFAVCLASNLVWTGLGVFALTRMFQSERIMFSH